MSDQAQCVDITEDAIESLVAHGHSVRTVTLPDGVYDFDGRGKLSGTWRYRRRTTAQEVTDDARP